MYKYIKIYKDIKRYYIMPDYSKGKIYKVLNTIDDEIYVGSTVETLGLRMAKHRSMMKTKPHFKLYKHMLELDVDNVYIEQLENYPCNDVLELWAQEGHYIREIGTLNKQIAGRTKKDYREEHKEEIQQYYKDNIELIKQYYEDHKESIKEQQKHYYEDNKERIVQRIKHYYEDNNKHINERLTCNICGCQVCRRSMTRHQKSQKCKSFVKPIENEE